MAITVRGSHTVLVQAPEDGLDAARVDVGEIALPEARQESQRQVHVLGSLPGDELWGLRVGAVHAWPGQRLAYPEGKRTPLQPREPGLYVAPEDLNTFIALALLREDHGPLLVLRPTSTWPRQMVTLDARKIPAARVTGTIPEEMLPARVQYTHLATGFVLTDSVGSSRSGTFTSRPIPPGHWDVSVQGVDGTTARRRAIELTADRTVDVGSIAPARGQMELTWPGDLRAGAICSLIYMRSGVPVAFEARTIGEPILSPDLEPGSYVVHVAARDGTWLAHGDVLPDQTTMAALDGESHVIGLLMGPVMRRDLPSDATFEIFDSKDELIRVIKGADLAPTGKLQWVVPTRDVARLRSTIGSLVYESRPLRRRSPDRAIFHVLKGRGVTRVR